MEIIYGLEGFMEQLVFWIKFSTPLFLISGVLYTIVGLLAWRQNGIRQKQAMKEVLLEKENKQPELKG